MKHNWADLIISTDCVFLHHSRCSHNSLWLLYYLNNASSWLLGGWSSSIVPKRWRTALWNSSLTIAFFLLAPMGVGYTHTHTHHAIKCLSKLRELIKWFIIYSASFRVKRYVIDEHFTVSHFWAVSVSPSSFLLKMITNISRRSVRNWNNTAIENCWFIKQ